MNNPMQQANFMARGSPPTPGGSGRGSGSGSGSAAAAAGGGGGHGPPISKKQRGGQTPGSIRASRLTTSIPRLGGRPGGRSGGGPPIVLGAGGGPPPTASMTRPPSGTSSATGGAMDDAIARRRAELRRLQEKSKMDRAAALKRNSNSPSVGSAAALGHAGHAGPPPPQPPMRPAGVSRHNSDIYPSVQPKSPSLTKNILLFNDTNIDEQQKTIEAFAAVNATNASSSSTTFNNNNNASAAASSKPAVVSGIVPPMMKTAGTGNTNTNTNTNTNPNMPPATPYAVPPTPAVGRKLEFLNSSTKKGGGGPSTAKAAAAAGGPPTTGTGGPPTAVVGGGPPRARSRSPTPSSSRTSNNDTSTSTSNSTRAIAAAALAERRNRAKSAPPVRPPGPVPPPGGPPRPPGTAAGVAVAGDAGGTAAAIAKKKVKARRPIPVSAADATIINNVDDNDNGNAADTNTAAQQHTDVGIGMMDTSHIPPATTTATTTAKTPIAAQKQSMYNNNDDGQKTPPSTGSSARRQKLQLMREQAAAATATASSSSSSAPATAAFAAAIGGGGGGPPATAAFAAAISGGNGGSAPPATAAFAAAIGATTSAATALPPPGKIAGSSADTNDVPSLRSESQSRLEDAYQKSEHDKTAALIKIKQLEDTLNQKTKDDLIRSKQNKPGNINSSNNIVEQLLQMAEMNGPEAALDWAKSQKGILHQQPGSPARPVSRVGFNTGMGVGTPMKSSSSGMNNMGSPTRRRIASRNLTPHPTKKQQRAEDPNILIPENENPEEIERRLIRQFREAAQYAPYEFSSELALYTVRRPYGIDGIIDGNIDDNSKNSAELFDYVKPPEESFDAYSRRAHVSSKSSIEVVAIIKGDNSPLLLFDTAGVRYKTNSSDNDNEQSWIHINNVDIDLDRPLGHITYVDEHAMEREYSLDEILEEALLVREQYCGTLTSTALGLDGRGPQQLPPVLPPVQQVEIPDLQKVSSRDVAVETDERGIGTDNNNSSPQQQTQQHTSPNVEKEAQETGDGGGGSSDVLVVFIGMMFTFIYNLLFGFFIGMPIRIIRTIFVFTISYIIIQMVHMHFADGYNEWVLNSYNGATTAAAAASYTMNDLVYYSNRQPGIM